MKKLEKLYDFLVITFGTVVVSCALYFFMLPSQVAVGSVAALAMILNNVIPIPVSVLTMMMNAGLLILGFLFIGREFGVKTVYTALFMPVVLGALEVMFPNYQSVTGEQTLDVICYCVLVAVGQAILFARNASSGGLDIVAKFMNKYMHMELGKAIGLVGMAVALCSVFVYDKKTLVLSILATYFNGIVVDHFIFGTTQKKRVCILSEHEKEILDYILHELHCGATKYHAYGAYSDAQRTEICTIMDKSSYQKLMTFLTKNYPDAFVTVYSVNETRMMVQGK